MRITVGICLLFLGLHAQAQKQFSPEQVIQIVLENHPIARQASIGVKKSLTEIRAARANFDPILSHYNAQKTIDGKNYYNFSNPSLEIPTWFGVQFETGIENLVGSRIDPSQTSGQLSYVGLSVPLLKNLIIDKRRALLAQAKIFNLSAQQEQRRLLNELVVEAVQAYWKWATQYQVVQTVTQNVNVTQNRFELIKKSFRLGDRPAIDTLEAFTQVQFFQQTLMQRQVQLYQSAVELSSFLWTTTGEGYDLPFDTKPMLIPQMRIDWAMTDLIQKALENQPTLLSYQLKLDALTIDKKLKFQNLLPKLDLAYRHIELANGTSDWLPLAKNNFQYGIKFEMPLRLSLGRATYQEAKLKIEETSIQFSEKKRGVELKIRNYYNEYQQLLDQIGIQEKAYGNYVLLTKAEEKRFLNGESSLFLINSRETKSLEAMEKLLELRFKLVKALYEMQGVAGLFA